VPTTVASIAASNERLSGLCCASRCARPGNTALAVVLGGQPRQVVMCAQHAARHTGSLSRDRRSLSAGASRQAAAS
jgi:hypothetical protein